MDSTQAQLPPTLFLLFLRQGLEKGGCIDILHLG